MYYQLVVEHILVLLPFMSFSFEYKISTYEYFE
jgi:hypothetical protein